MTLAVLLVVAILVWASDRITLQGERTIFTVKCQRGDWVNGRCTGTLVPGERYAFRASVRRQEVLYWIRGAQSPYGKFSDCQVRDRDNWTCTVPVGADAKVTEGMIGGEPTTGCAGLPTPLHRIAKWRWWVMQLAATMFGPRRG